MKKIKTLFFIMLVWGFVVFTASANQPSNTVLDSYNTVRPHTENIVTFSIQCLPYDVQTQIQYKNLAEIVESGIIPHNVTHLFLGLGRFDDISPLATLTNLEALLLGGHPINNLESLSGLTNLRWLRIIEADVSDISPLATLTNLEYLRLSKNSISDISPLSGLVNLRFLVLNYNPINDFSPLYAFPSLRRTGLDFEEWVKLGYILGNNHITIGDALEVLRFVANLPSVLDTCEIAFSSALIVSEYIPRIEDAIEILRYLVGLPSELDF